jgi:hypothetical protein
MKKILLLFSGVMILQSCFDVKPTTFRRTYKDANELIHSTPKLSTVPFLKAHMKDGSVYILSDTWTQDTITGNITGNGKHFDFNRRLMKEGVFEIPYDSLALFETNNQLQNMDEEFSSTLRALTVTNLIVTTICITNPKVCFGSCPTFYLCPTENVHYSAAEGFSNAIAPSLEYADIDALGNVNVGNEPFQLTMKNEALETHCVNSIGVYAVPVEHGYRTCHTNHDEFYRCSREVMPFKAVAAEGTILRQVAYDDKLERFSVSDSFNMASKEEIFLDYHLPDQTANSVGMLLDFRQSIMTTFLIYNAIAYMGDEVGDVFARMENGENLSERLKNGIQKELGGIEVYLKNNKSQKWELQGTFYETGPIAINSQLIPFSKQNLSGTVSVKLRLNKGLWRIDRAALAVIDKKVEPVKYTPTRVLRNGEIDVKAISQLSDANRHLISEPGDVYTLFFDSIPAQSEMDLFLRSEGYYWEWMRDYWLKEKNMTELRKMILRPAAYLRQQAKSYKQYENQIEEEFWNSRIEGKIFTRNEK